MFHSVTAVSSRILVTRVLHDILALTATLVESTVAKVLDMLPLKLLLVERFLIAGCGLTWLCIQDVLLELTDLIVELVPIVTELCFFSLLPLTLIYLVLVLVFICLLIVIILVTRLLLLLVAVEGVSNATTLLVVKCIGI